MQTGDHKLFTILGNNGRDKQLFVIMGELAEMVTMISDFFIRGRFTNDDVINEMADVYLQMNLLKTIFQQRFPNCDIDNLVSNAYNQKIEKAFAKSVEEREIQNTKF